jgi:hypothetical protein
MWGAVPMLAEGMHKGHLQSQYFHMKGCKKEWNQGNNITGKQSDSS